MEQVGEFSENPFDNGVNDIPISAICRNIEIDLKEILGETDLPEKIKPFENVLLWYSPIDTSPELFFVSDYYISQKHLRISRKK